MRSLKEIDADIEARRPQLDADHDGTMLLIDILLDERLEVMKYVEANSSTEV